MDLFLDNIIGLVTTERLWEIAWNVFNDYVILRCTCYKRGEHWQETEQYHILINVLKK
jgi:hypothetical protein